MRLPVFCMCKVGLSNQFCLPVSCQKKSIHGVNFIHRVHVDTLASDHMCQFVYTWPRIQAPPTRRERALYILFALCGIFHATTLIRQYSVQLTCLQSHGSLTNTASSTIGRVRYTSKVGSLDKPLTINQRR